VQVLAVSDVIVYRTRADRLHNDLFHFLGNASVAFRRHFSAELKSAARRFQSDNIDVSSLCPAVIVFHETQHTDPLTKGACFSCAILSLEMQKLKYEFVANRTAELSPKFLRQKILVYVECLRINYRIFSL